ncbi:MAG: hypothetical protein MUF83_05845 [Acidimicrobiales bacterium]|nr:hypothetical protein [Acidimicrobiales bacterium]
MFKRVTWFSMGAASGFGVAVYGYVRLREATRVRPEQVADSMVGAARSVGGALRDAYDEGRDAMRATQASLEAGWAPRAVRGSPPRPSPSPAPRSPEPEPPRAHRRAERPPGHRRRPSGSAGGRFSVG